MAPLPLLTRIVLLLHVLHLLHQTERASAQPRQILQPGCDSDPTFCINIGSRKNINAFNSETPNVISFQPSTPKGFRVRRSKLKARTDGRAYARGRRNDTISFTLSVAPEETYTLTLGFVDVTFCENGGLGISFTANGRRSDIVNSPLFDRCGAPFLLSSDAVSDASGQLSVTIVATTARMVPLATVCASRHLLSQSPCSQKGCANYQGCGDYAIASGSLAIPDAPCATLPSATAELALPAGAAIQDARLQWAASGVLLNTTTSLLLNGERLVADRVWRNSDFEPFYGASADVTDRVREIGAGVYNVSGIFHSPFLSCPQAHLSAWTLIVVYGAPGAPVARINVCDRNTVSSLKKRTLKVKCMVGGVGGVADSVARANVVAVEGEEWNEDFNINGRKVGNNLFFGSSGERLDILEFDAKEYLQTARTKVLKFQFGKNKEDDSVIITALVTYQTLPQQE